MAKRGVPLIAKDQADIWEHIKPILAKNRYLIFLIELIIILSFINSHLFTLAVVKGDSMYPTLSDRDIVLVSCSNQMPERGDIVLAHAALDEMDRYIVKRVIAVAGENITIDYSSNVIYVNGKEIPEPYICYTQTDPMKPRNGTSLVEYLVPADSFFVLGDNRNFSTDSRDSKIGYINKNEIVGIVRAAF